MKKSIKRRGVLVLGTTLLFTKGAYSQIGSGADSIGQVTAELQNSYIPVLESLLLALGSVIGIIGAIKVYISWNQGERDVNKQILSWGGSCVFLVVVSMVLNGFFG